jgi:hypothetical protein
MKLVVSNLRRTWPKEAMTIGKTASLSTASSVVSQATQLSQSEITAAMVRSLYRDFLHILKVQQKQSKAMTTKSQSQRKDPLQQVRDEFRQPLLNDTTGSTSSIESRYQNGINRFSFLRMNTVQYKPRTHNHTNSYNAGTETGTERYIYKNGQRFALHSIQEDGTLRNNQRGYVISPYDGKNLDPQSVTRHRQSLKRAGFINNLHAKGMF